MKKALLHVVALLLMATVHAQTRVTGYVTDAKGNPLHGVTIAVKGTANGTVSDSSGRFDIRVPGPQTTLVFSLVSYETKEEPVGKRQKMTVILAESGNSMNDVVVIGYGTQKKRDLTGAITTITSKQLEERHTSSLGDALQGMAAGVLVTTAAEPGAQPTIQIRGYSTFSSSGNTPLYVIDGILSDNMSWVNPNDVQSVEILKDAASAAIYGSRSANGVIIVTTKRGIEGKPRIGVQYLHVSGVLAHKLPQANSKEVRLYRNEQGSSGVSTDSLNPSYNADNDYQSVLTRVANRDQVDFSASGAGKGLNFYTSIRAVDDQGLIYNSYAKTLFFRTNVEFSPNSKFRYFGRMQFGYTTGNVIDEGNTIFQAFQRPANYALYNPDGSLTGYISGRRNPLTVVLDQVNLNQNYNGSLFNQIDYTFIPELRLTANAVATYTEIRNQQFLPKILSSNNPLTNNGSESFSRIIDWQSQAYLNYMKTFGGAHAVSLMAGTSAEASQTNGANEAAVNYVSEQVLTLNSGTIIPNGTTTTATADSRASLFGRATYGYKGRYLFATTIRRDGSSRFGPDNRWGDFFSASAAWRFSDERFLRWSNSFLDDGKLRLSYGQTGNESIGDYTAQTTYGFGTYYYNGISGIAPSTTLGNPTLQWEATTQKDLGLDLSFLRSRLLVVADVYEKITTNLLTQSPLPAETGFSNYEVNYGSIRNRGFELSVTGRPVLRRNFDWLVIYNLSVQRGIVTRLNAGLPAIQGNSADAAG
ncbi:MAG TPA: SusC/RagA family TonB-linked outer membrane protein, partial [Puia sp.]|nr:SusC/RagA family TonB-linked outer membrane protein [Puia sp.]